MSDQVTEPTPEPRAPVAGFAFWLILLGLGLIAWGVVYDPSIDVSGAYGLPERVVNTGKLATKQMIFSAGGVSFVSGMIMMGVAVLRDEISKARRG